jgi:hypothetical protein
VNIAATEMELLRQESLRALGRTTEDVYASRVKATLFKQQLDFIEDKAHPMRTACCSRRAGKTQGVVRGLLDGAMREPKGISVYFATTLSSARKLVWDSPDGIPALIHELGLKAVCEVNETEHRVKFENGHVLWVSGCETLPDARRWKGLRYNRAVPDEAQDWPEEILAYLVNEVLAPALMDRNGEIWMTGTPSPRLSGLFYDATNGILPGWGVHAWTCFDNPFLPKAREYLDLTMKTRGLTVSDPIIQREFFGRWLRDVQTQLYHYEPGRNDFTELPNAKSWSYVLGLDFGSRDLTTFVLHGYRPYDPCLYGITAYGEPMAGKASVTRTLEIIGGFQSKFGFDIEIVGDTGALGLMIADEMRHRPPGVAIIPAKKTEKASAIRIMNDQFRLGLIKYSRDCEPLREQLLKLQIDLKTQIEKPSQACDFADAALYSFRHSYQYLAEKAPDSTPAGMQKALVAQIIQKRQQEIARSHDDAWGERQEMIMER